MNVCAAETADLTNAPNQDMVASQVTKRPVGINTLSNTRRKTNRASFQAVRFSYGRANGRTARFTVTGSGSVNPVRPAASEINTSGGRFFKPTTRRPIMAHNLQAESALVSSNLKTTSLIVAECFGKRHDNVVRAIEALEIPKEYRLLNFEERVREVSHGSGANREYRAYELTRDGFALLVMGFTGKRAMHWKIRFLEAFNAMEAELLTSSAHYHQSNNGLNRLTGYLDVLLLDESMMSAEWKALDRVRKITRELSKQGKEMKE